MTLKLYSPKDEIIYEETTDDKDRVTAYYYEAEVRNKTEGLEDAEKKWRFEVIQEPEPEEK